MMNPGLVTRYATSNQTGSLSIFDGKKQIGLVLSEKLGSLGGAQSIQTLASAINSVLFGDHVGGRKSGGDGDERKEAEDDAEGQHFNQRPATAHEGLLALARRCGRHNTGA